MFAQKAVPYFILLYTKKYMFKPNVLGAKYPVGAKRQVGNRPVGKRPGGETTRGRRFGGETTWIRRHDIKPIVTSVHFNGTKKCLLFLDSTTERDLLFL